MAFPRAKGPVGKFLASLLEVGVIAGVAVAATFLIRQYVFNPYSIVGASMSPNFREGDYVFVDEMSYHFRAPQRGEVVVFHAPFLKSEDLIKRIVGLPGERVVVKDGTVTVFNTDHPQGFALDESYLGGAGATNGSADVALGPNQYFVMGDNRPVSYDSRSWGPLAASDIVGRVLVRIWPPDATKVFAAPKY